MHVYTVARLLQQIVYNNKNQLSTSLIIAGYDPYKGSQIYCIKSGGSITEEEFAMSGSGSTFLRGFKDSSYRSNMTYEEARKLAIDAIALAQASDGSSGGSARIVNCTKDNWTEEMVNYNSLPYTKC